MKIKFQLLDADYILNNSKPTVRLFGKTDDNKSITIFYDGFLPYFYILPKPTKKDDIKKFLEKEFKQFLIKIETVDKFPAIGYEKNPKKILKITLNNPSKVPMIRDRLEKNPNVERIFEADILFKYRFMADKNLYGMRWYEVDGTPVRTGTTKTKIKIKAKSFKEIDKEEYPRYKYLSFDLEIFMNEKGMPDPDKDKIILLSMFFYPAFNGKNTMVLCSKKIKNMGNDVLGFESEKEMLKKFLDIVDRYDPDFFVGYNVNGFDLPYLERRLANNNLSRAIGRCATKPILCRKFGNTYKNSIVGRCIVDVYELVRAGTRVGMFKGLKRYGLGDVSKMILNEDKVDIARSEINKRWEDHGEKFKKLVDYNRKDSELPMKILLNQKLLDKYLELCKVTGVLIQDALSSGEATRIENLVLREFNKKNFIIPCKPTDREISKRNIERRERGLKGAFVLNPAIGFHDTCVVYLDFKSMYPSIIQSFNICPTTLITSEKNVETIKTITGTKFVSPTIRRGIIPEILKNLIETRDKIKKEMKRATTEKRKRYLYAKQNALKVTANAFYGYSGYLRAKLYVLEIANAITGTGRDLIHKTKNIVETQTEYKVVYADTDSVMVKLKTKDLEEAFKEGKRLSEIINNGINNILKIKIESIFKTLLILSKKRYVGWSFEPMDHGWDESFVMKGIETVRRDWCDLVSETLTKVLDTILKKQDIKKAVDIVKEEINKIKTGEVDINKLVITKSITKSSSSYKGIQPHIELLKKMKKRDPSSAPGIGDRIGFVIVKGMQMLSKRAEDPNYIKQHNLEIDSRYYIESQLLPPLERVFDSLNVNKSELLGVGKQLGLFEAMKNGIKKKENIFEDKLTDIDGFICNNCNTIFRRVPLSGKCNLCEGEIVFYKGNKKSREYDPWKSQTSTK
ncbi:MAG: hypothetical protein B6U88_01885 [Candidatus Aenigmarchaeota archaeon ex4484_56]|nr:MAG: hypothetical protein B6U88_01885 [Candidatus Aenigmarchaeota archaeon ex4484_56]